MLEVGFIFWSHESQVLAAYSTFPALLETLFATFDVDRNGRIDLEARIGTNLRWRMAGLNDPSKRWRITSLQKRFIVGVVIFSMFFFWMIHGWKWPTTWFEFESMSFLCIGIGQKVRIYMYNHVYTQFFAHSGMEQLDVIVQFNIVFSTCWTFDCSG